MKKGYFERTLHQVVRLLFNKSLSLHPLSNSTYTPAINAKRLFWMNTTPSCLFIIYQNFVTSPKYPSSNSTYSPEINAKKLFWTNTTPSFLFIIYQNFVTLPKYPSPNFTYIFFFSSPMVYSFILTFPNKTPHHIFSLLDEILSSP